MTWARVLEDDTSRMYVFHARYYVILYLHEIFPRSTCKGADKLEHSTFFF